MIRIARKEDIDQIMTIVQETIEDLNQEGNYQWDETYPKEEHFLEDIHNNHLYIVESEDRVVGFICINQEEDETYQKVEWRLDEPALVIHRFAIKRDKLRQGLGTKLVEFAIRFAENKGIHYVKVDTNSKNIRMNALFQKLGFVHVGQIHLRNVEDPFNCYDYIIESKEG